MYSAQIVISNIDSAIKSKGYTKSQVCEALNINKNTINTMTDNKGIASFTLARIADYLGVSVDFLLGRCRPALAASAPALDSNAARMLSMFSQLSEEKQEFLLKQAEMYLDAEQPKEKAALV